MKKEEILSTVVRTANQIGFTLKKKSPEIFVVLGITGAIASGVMACLTTRKIDPSLEETADRIDDIHANLEVPDLEYTEHDGQMDLVKTYAHAGIQFAKLYGPSLIIGSLSITGILVSNNILRKRNVALAAAYTALDKGFKQYRKNVVDRFGEKVDHDLRYSIKAKKIEETVTDENGKTKVVKKTVDIVDANLASPYAFYFTPETSYNCGPNMEYNLMFLRAQQTYLNDMLRSQHKHVFLNEVCDAIDMKTRTKGGQLVGWVYNEEHPTGDNFIDLGITTVNREVPGGYETVILLDPNVDGDILDSDALELPKI